MTLASSAILERFRRGRPGDIDLTLRPAYRDLLHHLGHPQNRLPPVFHIAGTNGKGSTCAFLRAMLEAAGYRVHVYTSPHLVEFHERIRIAGTLISEEELSGILVECEKLASLGGVTYFEAATAAAFSAFVRHPADFTILETGLGGRLDATNIVEQPLASVITRISYDHREYLGTTLEAIAREKAGIMRRGVPCFTSLQPDAEALKALQGSADMIHAPLSAGGKDWRVEPLKDGFRFVSNQNDFELPSPGLIGAHQFWNAGLGIATLMGSGVKIDATAIATGLRRVEWPARLQRLEHGALAEILPQGWELWLDGGHNDSAGEALAVQAATWRTKDNKPLHIIVGMMKTKNPAEFLGPLAPHAASLRGVDIQGEDHSFSATELIEYARTLRIDDVATAVDIRDAVGKRDVAASGRILICGSLYLAGSVLRQNAK